ncbi:MAG: DUF262 domain-containing protein, partial [Leptospiraceae bacterium]|nr:DUF262 domain-containing protein [Leptospiraceae bacterium]
MEKQSSLSELIANKASVGSIPILELATALSSPSARRSLKLPAFQRDAVWDEDRLSTLWDSLLRGYPIGSLILCPAGGFIGRQISSRAAQSSLRQQAHQSHELAEGELLILDGQQRSIAIALGFRLPVEGLTERLWIDLEPKEELSSGARFYLCTALRPWGAKVPFDSPEELSALEALQLANRREFQKNNDAMLLQSYPLHACLPVPMAEWLDAVARDRVFDPPQLAYIHPDLRNLYVKKSAELSAAIAAMHLQIKQLRQQVIPLQIVYSLQTI